MTVQSSVYYILIVHLNHVDIDDSRAHLALDVQTKSVTHDKYGTAGVGNEKIR